MGKLFTWVLIGLLLFTLPVFAQTDFNFNNTGNGARGAAMGYAFTGIADDATAISWNPAGLTQLYAMEATVVGRVKAASVSYDNLPTDIETFEIEQKSQFQLNFASFVVPFNTGGMNVDGGVAFRKYYDFANEVTYTVMPTFGMESEFTETTEGGVNAISPSVGVKLTDLFSVGATLNILTGSVSYSEEGYDINSEYETDYSGMNIDVGFLAKISPQFSAGAKLTLPHTLKWENADGGSEIGLELPLFFAVGVAFRATDQFTLSADFQSRPFSGASLTIDDEKVEGFEIENNLNSIHFGAEYLLTMGDVIVPLRAGFFTNPSLMTDAEDNQIVENVFAFGGGLVMGNFIINGSMEIGVDTHDEDWGYSDYVQYSGATARMTLGSTIHF
ncbi:MAG: hypothetical protein GF313_16880 [Caldithrix sp.]|nr:hypothetical protein [Caldithrix sp.]